MKKLYIIIDSKSKEDILKFNNKKDARKELNRMNNGEQDVCSPEGISKPYRLKTLDDLYIVCDTSSSKDYLKGEFNNKKEAVKYAKKLYKDNPTGEFNVGIKCMRDFLESYNITDCGIAYDEIMVFSEYYEN